MGLVSDGGVHSHEEHLEALLALCGAAASRPVLHVFLDGRDTPPRSGLGYRARAAAARSRPASGRVATVIGRYYAMDRDNRWERIGARLPGDRAAGEGLAARIGARRGRAAYARDEGDEFVKPTVIDGGARARATATP